MVRQTRYVLPGQPQHVIQRGNNRCAIFVRQEDYCYFLDRLDMACERYGCRIHAYVLMTNHVHLLITPDDEFGIGRVMQSVGRSYVQYFNYSYQRTGTLWEGRYRSTLIDAESYLLSCYRYIELNPVRAGMVKQPLEYRWSSYRCNGEGIPDPLVSPHAVYAALGSDCDERREAYRALFRHRLDECELEVIRDSTNKAWVLGNALFKEYVAELVDRQVSPKPRGGDRRSKSFRINRV